MGIQETFARNLRTCRKKAHLSQEKLAELASLHRTYIGGIEQERINVSLKNIGKIADALEVDPATLFRSEFADNGSTDACEPRASRDPQAAHEPCSDDARLPHKNTNQIERPIGTGDGPDYALCTWSDGGATVLPIDVAYEDLTIQILCNLISEGYTGDDLVKRYSKVQHEILSFLGKR